MIFYGDQLIITSDQGVIKYNTLDNTWEESSSGIFGEKWCGSIVLINDDLIVKSWNYIYISKAKGTLWTPLFNPQLPSDAYNWKLYLSKSNSMLFVTLTSGLYSYNFNTKNWKLLNNNLNYSIVYDIYFDQDTMYAITYSNKLYKNIG